MLAFDPEDDLVRAAATSPIDAAPVKKRTVSFDGTFEELDGDDPLGLENYDAFIAEHAPVRDLDKELEAETCVPGAQPGRRCARELSLTLEGPVEVVERVLAALRRKWIEVPPIRLRIEDPNAP